MANKRKRSTLVNFAQLELVLVHSVAGEPVRAARGEPASLGGARRAVRAPAKRPADPVGNTGITSYRPAPKVVAGALTS